MKFIFVIFSLIFLISPSKIFSQETIDTTTFLGLMIKSNRSAIKGNYKEMLRFAEKAIAFSESEKGRISVDYIGAMRRKGNALANLERFDEALSVLDTALSLADGVLDTIPTDYGNIYRVYGNVYMNKGALEGALTYYKKAINYYPEENDYHGIITNQIALIYYWSGDIDTSLNHFFKILEKDRMKMQNWKNHPTAPADEIELMSKITSDAIGSSLNNIASIYMTTGQLKKAAPLLEEAIYLVQKYHSKKHYRYLSRGTRLANLYGRTGQYEKSIELGKELLAISKEVNEANGTHYFHEIHLVASLYLEAGQSELALPYALDAISKIEDSPLKDHPAKAGYLITLGMIYQNLDKHKEALPCFESAITIIEQNFDDNHRDYAIALNEIAETYAYLDQNEAFLNLMKKVKNGAGDFRKNLAIYPVILSNKAIAHKRLEELENSKAEYKEIGDLLTSQIKEQFDFFSEEEQLDWVKTIQPFKEEIQSFDFAYRTKIDSEGSALNTHILFKELVLGNRKKLLETIRSNSDQELIGHFEAWKATLNKLSSEYHKPKNKQTVDLDSLEAVANRQENILARKSQKFKAAREIVNWTDIQNQLTEGEAVLEFSHFSLFNDFTQTDSIIYIAYLLKKNSKNPLTLFLFGEKDLKNTKATKSLYAFNEQPGLQNLHHLIYKPLEANLTEIKTIYYAPSGLLHRINFGAIPINDNQTISDRFELHNIGSSRQLVFPQKSPNQEITDAQIFGGIQYEIDETILTETTPINETDELLASRKLGDSFRSLRGSDWNYLEWTEQEAEDIQKILESSGAKVQVHRGLKASEEIFKQIGKNKPSPRILHLATHGYFFPDVDTSAVSGFQSSKHPLIRSGIVLAGANAAWKGEAIEGQEDGILTAYEIAQMDLSNTELVVLSACDTGLGDIEGNEGVYGLQRAFKLAGVKYVLMSLWSVSDKKTYDFMTTFYKEWLAGKMIPQAYQNTQNAMRKKYALPFNPRNWAGFVLVE